MLRDEDVDRILREDAADWRARTDADSHLDLSKITNNGSRSSLGRILARMAAAGILVAFTAAAVVIGMAPRPQLVAAPSPGNSLQPSHGVQPSASLAATMTVRPTVAPATSPPVYASPSPTLLQPEDVSFGDEVVGLGQIIDIPGSQPYLCADVLTTGFGVPGCGMSLEVDVFDFEPRTFSGSSHNGIWLTEKIEIRGTWERDGVHVTSATIVDPPGFPLVPCAAPPGGWPGVVGDIDAERANLDHYLIQHIDRVIGPWLTSVDGREPTPESKVLVVGTIDDPTAIYGELGTLYRSNLCVVHVDYSYTTLMQVKQSIGPANGLFAIEVDDRRGRLLVKPFMLTQDVVEQLAEYAPFLIVEPLVRLAR
jgi:hypothetical protein